MQFELFLATLLPLVLFVFVEIKYGLKAGVWAALITAAAAAGYFYFRLGEIDAMTWAELGLIAFLGLITLKVKNAKFLKFQPVVMAVCLALYVGYNQIYAEPILLRFKSVFIEMKPEAALFFLLPGVEDFLAETSWHFIILFVVHGLLVLWGALKLGSFGWLLTRLAIYPLLAIFLFYEYKRFMDSGILPL